MKKLKLLLVCLVLALSCGVFNATTFIVQAADPQVTNDPQGTGDTTKPQPCYPRCRPVSAPDTGGTGSAASVTGAAATTGAAAEGELTITTTVILALVQFWAGL